MRSLFSSIGRPGRSFLLLGLLVAVAAITAHAGTLRAGLVFDDVPIVRDNPLLVPDGPANWSALLTAAWWPTPGHDLLWRPLTLLLIGLQTALGSTVAGLHAGNLALHAAVAVLLFVLTRRLGGSRAAATTAGVLFAVHPLTSEAVTLVVGRADLLAALGTLLAGLAATHRRDPARARSWPGLLATGGAVGLACLAKENGFVSPLLVGVVLAVPACRKRSGTPAAAATGTASATARPRVDRHQRGPSTGTAGWIRERLPLALAVLLPIVVVLLLRLAVLGQLMRGTPPAFDDNPIAHAGLVAGRLTALRLLGHSLLLFLRPWPLSIDYSHAALPVPAVSLASVWPVLVGALLLGVLAWVLRRRPVALCGLAWFFVAQAATANLLVPIGTIYAERLLYLPLAGICLLVGDLTGALVAPLTRRSPGTPRRVLVAGFALITLAVPALLTARTWAREAEFKDDLTVWNAAVSAVPGSAKAHYNLGRSLAARDRHIDAAEQYREALRIAPTHVLALNNLGASELRRQRPAEALVALDRAAALAPGAAEVAFNQALALHALDRVEAAATAFARGALSDPALARTLAARGEPWASLAAGTR